MITGNVARIISEKEIVLNVGKTDGVKEGMEFVIYSESEKIFDPETGEDLGSLEIIKGRVTVYHVQEKLSRAKTSTYQSGSAYASIDYFQAAISGSVTRYSLLEVKDEDKKPIKEDKVVRIGDKLHSVL